MSSELDQKFFFLWELPISTNLKNEFRRQMWPSNDDKANEQQSNSATTNKAAVKMCIETSSSDAIIVCVNIPL